MDIKLSIIVPTLDSHKKLPKLIKKLKEQTEEKWRVIFVDGRSCQEHKNFLQRTVEADSRFKVVTQSQYSRGIFGAMNDGWREVESDEWSLFWGSDDWPSSNKSLELIKETISQHNMDKVLLAIFCGNYVSGAGKHVRKARFIPEKGSRLIYMDEFRDLLVKGYTPPHQGTLFSPRMNTMRYNDAYKICADLEIFLRISGEKGESVLNNDLDIITMENSGISSQRTLRRLMEVSRAYRKQQNGSWYMTMTKRYIEKIISRIKRLNP